jgi:hypothetical protein
MLEIIAMVAAAQDPYEICREQYKPLRTLVLFIGESRPSNGTFFYCGNSFLARYTCEAFCPEGSPFLEMEAFLAYFKTLGCFLVDLCPEPLNQRPQRERKRAHKLGVAALAGTLSELQPLAIVVVMKAISTSVTQAVGAAKSVRRYDLPFPAQGHQRAYVARLRDIVSDLRRDGLLQDSL